MLLLGCDNVSAMLKRLKADNNTKKTVLKIISAYDQYKNLDQGCFKRICSTLGYNDSRRYANVLIAYNMSYGMSLLNAVHEFEKNDECLSIGYRHV